MRETSLRNALVIASCASGLITAACAMSAPFSRLNADLRGTQWVASAIDGDPISPARAPRITFGAEDRLSGSSGCNRMIAVYEAENGRIDVRALGHTEMACDAGTMRQEAAFLSILDRASRYERRDGRLTITGEDGASLSFDLLA